MAAVKSMSSQAPISPEFSRIIRVDHLGPREVTHEILATDLERAHLAERLGLVSLDRLAATVRLQRLPDALVRVSGRWEAEVVQSCVVTLEPVAARLAEDFTTLFGGAGIAATREVVIGFDEADPPEAIVDGAIDIGETVVQQLAVSIEPYPRSPGAEARLYRSDSGDSASNGGGDGPFAILRALRKSADRGD
jgi:hypothetical protein